MLSVLFCLGQGCATPLITSAPFENPSLEQFRSSWDYAVKRVTYDEVVRAWGMPTSRSNINDKIFLAVWHWDHTLNTPDAPDLGFGERMELSFNTDTRVLSDWKYFHWGPEPVRYAHRSAPGTTGTWSIRPPGNVSTGTIPY